jgi:UV DNA damage repair endonuclease
VVFGLGLHHAVHHDARDATRRELRVWRSAMRSTWTITSPPELRAAVAMASDSSTRASFSMVMLPSRSAVVPRRMATSMGKVL